MHARIGSKYDLRKLWSTSSTKTLGRHKRSAAYLLTLVACSHAGECAKRPRKHNSHDSAVGEKPHLSCRINLMSGHEHGIVCPRISRNGELSLQRLCSLKSNKRNPFRPMSCSTWPSRRLCCINVFRRHLAAEIIKAFQRCRRLGNTVSYCGEACSASLILSSHLCRLLHKFTIRLSFKYVIMLVLELCESVVQKRNQLFSI